MSAKCHDDIIEAILSVIRPRRGVLRLLGRVQDPRLRHSTADDLFFLIPDLHLLTPRRQKAFGKREFNYRELGLLGEILGAMAVLKKQWDKDGTTKLRTFQLGDFFDIWREFPGQVDPSKVGDEVYSQLRDVLYRGVYRGLSCLKASFLVGNHDVRDDDRLPELNFWTKAFNYSRRASDKPFFLAFHGDVFDFIEKFPTFIKSLMVNIVGTLTPLKTYPVGVDMTRINKPLKDLTAAITEPDHTLSALGAPRVTGGEKLPRYLCNIVTNLKSQPLPHKYLGRVHEMIEMARREDLTGSNVRIVAIGHTHQAKMAFYAPETEEPPILLMDIGAWIENCSYPRDEDGQFVTEPSAQIGVIHANDARLYQIYVPSPGD